MEPKAATRPPPDGVAVVTVRSEATTQNATFELLEIIAEVTSVALLTTVISRESPICNQHEFIEISDRGTGGTVIQAAGRFVLNQLLFCYAIRRREEEAVLFFGATAYLLPILFARLIGRTVIVEPRGDVPLTLRLQWEEQLPSSIATLLAGLVRLQERLGYLASSAIITYTPAMAEELNLGRFAGKLYTDGARYVPTDRFDRTTEYDERENRIGYVGRLDVEKGIPTLIEVVERLSDDLDFTFVGDGPYRQQIEERLAAEIEAGQVEITGWLAQRDVPAELNRLKLLVMPSQPTEGLPTTILEAFACGTPVYATPVAGVPDVVREGETGFLMTEEEPSKIAARIEKILAEEDLSEMSRSCRSLIEEDYSFEATVTRYREMLTKIEMSA